MNQGEPAEDSSAPGSDCAIVKMEDNPGDTATEDERRSASEDDSAMGVEKPLSTATTSSSNTSQAHRLNSTSSRPGSQSSAGTRAADPTSARSQDDTDKGTDVSKMDTMQQDKDSVELTQKDTSQNFAEG